MDRPLRIAVLSSHRAPGLAELFDHPSRGSAYDIVCCMTSEPDFADRGVVEARGVPLFIHPIRLFHRQHHLSLSDLHARRDYDGMTVSTLSHFQPDFVFLLGYLYLLTRPMLVRYRNRIINIHDSDLTLLDANGAPRYVGLHAVRDAILAGERETRVTAHIVTEDLDAGPILLRSPVYPVAALVEQERAWGAIDAVKAYAYAHRDWMIRSAFGPLAVETLLELSSAFRLPDSSFEYAERDAERARELTA